MPHVIIKISWKEKLSTTINVAPGKKKIHRSGTVMSHYHYHMDPNLGEGKCALRRLHCACVECIDQLDHA